MIFADMVSILFLTIGTAIVLAYPDLEAKSKIYEYINTGHNLLEKVVLMLHIS